MGSPAVTASAASRAVCSVVVRLGLGDAAAGGLLHQPVDQDSVARRVGPRQ